MITLDSRQAVHYHRSSMEFLDRFHMTSLIQLLQFKNKCKFTKIMFFEAQNATLQQTNAQAF